MRKKLSLSLVAAAVVAGCGGGGGGGSPGGSVSGSVVKGPVTGSTVCAYALAALGKGSKLGCTTSKADGSYTLDLAYTGPVVIEATGGTYTDEATGTAGVALDAPLRAAGVVNTGSNTLMATPLTALAFSRAVAGGNLTIGGFETASSEVRNAFGLPSDVSLTGTLPVVSGKVNAYGNVLAGISGMIKAGATLTGLLANNDLNGLRSGYNQTLACNPQLVSKESPTSVSMQDGIFMEPGTATDGSVQLKVQDPLASWRILLPASGTTMGCTLSQNTETAVQLTCPALAMINGISIYGGAGATVQTVPADLPASGVLVAGRRVEVTGALSTGPEGSIVLFTGGSVLAAQPIQVSESILLRPAPPSLTVLNELNICVLGGKLQPSGVLSATGLGGINGPISWQTYNLEGGGGVTFTQPSTSSQGTKTFTLGGTVVLGTLSSSGSSLVLTQAGAGSGPVPSLVAGSLIVGGTPAP